MREFLAKYRLWISGRPARLESATEELLAKRLIVGLGNPGRKYEGTRHNVGFLVVDRIAERAGAAFIPQSKWKALVAKISEQTLLVKPLTFMNESGRAIHVIADFYKIVPQDCLVVYDDVALPFGQLRIRRGGSAGGHNGIKSLIQSLGTQEFPRVRFGIGESAQRKEMSAHVLGKFSKSEEAELPLLLEQAADAVECVWDKGIDVAMADWNGKK